jgi:hypothetical protein
MGFFDKAFAHGELARFINMEKCDFQEGFPKTSIALMSFKP